MAKIGKVTVADPRPLGDQDPMPQGEHQGKALGDVPASYLLWIADQPFAADPRWAPVADYARRNRDVLEAEAEAEAEADDDDEAPELDVSSRLRGDWTEE